MTTAEALRTDVDSILNYGDRIRIKYFVGSVGSAFYDDQQVLTQTGTDIWTSGLIQPINTSIGGYDASFLEQGKIMQNDSKLYINGRINTSGILRIGVGSPSTREYSMLPDGTNVQLINGSPVYKKVFIRILPLGSLYGETV